jgi:hypothetical protein
MSVRDVPRRPVCDSDMQYLVRETDDERAPEIASEFYPEARWIDDEHVDTPGRTDEQDESSNRICKLASQLGYREVQIRMLLGEWATNLANLERRLLVELSQQSGKRQSPNDGNGNYANADSPPREEPFPVEGFPI